VPEDKASRRAAFVGAVSWLAAETGLPRETVAAVVQRRSRTTALSVADRLVAAIGRPDAFHDGTLPVRPNPLAPRSVRTTCCGGGRGGPSWPGFGPGPPCRADRSGSERTPYNAARAPETAPISAKRSFQRMPPAGIEPAHAV
jgi:hypothetical protein